MSETTKMRAPLDNDNLLRWAHDDTHGHTLRRVCRELLAYRTRYGDIDAPSKSPPGSAWFSHSPDGDGFEVWPTAAEAKAAAEKSFAAEEPMDGWSDGVESICWGRVHGQVIKTEERPRLSGDNHDYDTTQAFELSAPEHRELEQLRGLHETVTAALDRVTDDADLRGHLVVALRLYRTVRRIVERTESHKRVLAPQPVAEDCTWLGDCEPTTHAKLRDRVKLLNDIAALRAEVEREKGLRESATAENVELKDALANERAMYEVFSNAAKAEAERRDEIIACEKGLRKYAEVATALVVERADRTDARVQSLNVDLDAAKAEAARYRAAIVRCLRDWYDDRTTLRLLALALLPDEERGA